MARRRRNGREHQAGSSCLENRQPKDIGARIQKKIPVYLVSEDAAERGIPSSELLPGIETISRSGLAKLFDGFDRVVHW